MRKCGPKGRDCIEGNSTRSFNCSVTCEGVYADIEWLNDGFGKEMEGELAEVVSNEELDEDLLNTEMFKRLRRMELMYNDLKKEVKLMKSSSGKKGEELDKEKYLRLIAEYRNFKENNVKHFRFSSSSTLSMFGKPKASMLSVYQV